MSDSGNEVWKNRILGVQGQINKLAGQGLAPIEHTKLHKQAEHQQAVITVLKKLLECLNEFGERQFAYFYDGFFVDDPNKKLKPSKKYPPEHVVDTTLDQIEYDYWVISHALSQRESGGDKINKILQIADILSRWALKPALNCCPIKMQVISYLHKSPSIRIIPYARVALIGIPPTVASVPRDYLAIPHEIGHMVYWLSKVKVDLDPSYDSLNGEISIASVLQREKVEKNVVANRWIEELFADIYGASLAGPPLALSFQDLSLQVSQDEFFEDDGDHPPPVLRPNIYTKVLYKTGYEKCAVELHKRWNGENNLGGRINDRLEKEREKTSEQGGTSRTDKPAEKYERAFRKKDGKYQLVEEAFSTDPSVELDEDKQIEKVVKSIFEKIHGNENSQPLMSFNDNNWWRKILGDGTDIDKVYRDFREKIQGSQDPVIEQLAKTLEFEQEVNNFEIEVKDIVEERVDLCVSFDELKDRWIKEFQWIASEKNKNQEILYEWLPVFIASGWTTEGPHSNPPGP